MPEGLELDEHDDQAVHWIARSGNEVVATARARVVGHDVKAERVAVRPDLRGSSLGRALMRAVEDWARAAGFRAVRLHAQSSAVAFYARLDYSAEGPPFEEAGISHRSMRKLL